MRFLRWLLALFPAGFRQEFASEIEADLRRQRREAAGPGLATFWARATGDLLRHALLAHWDILRQDLRFVARSLVRRPGYAATAVLVTAIGVGANAAAFSVADYVLVRPLPFPAADRLVKLWQHPPGYPEMELSPANYRDWKDASSTFESMGAFTNTAANLTGLERPDRIQTTLVGPELLPLLGANPLLGRRFDPNDAEPGAPRTMVVSERFWRDRLGAAPGAVGSTLALDGIPHQIIGVLPVGFAFPDRRTDVWLPLTLDEASLVDRANNYLEVLARLRDGVTIEQARADLAVIADRLARQYPAANEGTGATVQWLRDSYSQRSRLLLLALVGASLCILLIACANLGSLLLARALARESELVVRAALGAGRDRLIRQAVTECLVIVAAGGLAGLAVAAAAIPLLARLVPESLPLHDPPTLDRAVIGFAAVATAVTAILLAVLTGRRAEGNHAAAVLRGGQRGGNAARERLRQWLLAGEVAASVVLLVTAGLLLRAVQRVAEVDPGFQVDGAFTVRTALPASRYLDNDLRDRFYRDVQAGVAAIPGVEAAAYTTCLPMVCGGMIWPASPDGDPQIRAVGNTASVRFVTPGYIATLGIPLLRGREVTEADRRGGQDVAVVSASFAERHWPGEDGLGKRFTVVGRNRMVVGVVADIRVRGLERTAEPQLYLPASQIDSAMGYYWPQDLVVRSSLTPAALLPQIERTIAAIDRDQPLTSPRALTELVSDQTATRGDQVRMVVVLGAIALVLATIGIHGLLSYLVTARARELGVRMALGASRSSVVRLVASNGLRLVAAGAVPGLILSYLAARAIRAVLFGVPPGDLITYATVLGICLVVALVGATIPAWRAARVDPAAMIRSD